MEIHSKSSISILFLVVLIHMFQHSCLGQNSIQDYLDAHNTARMNVGANIGNMTWDDNVADYAQRYANQRIDDCKLVHSNSQDYGENIAVEIGSYSLTGVDAVKLWVNEGSDYDYTNNQCAPEKMCEHYTQVMWRNSTRLGCARVECYNGGGVFVTCNYYPPGNYIDKRPY